MKEAITTFDLEAAFKALDDIEIPKVGKVKANRPALTEIFSRKTKLDALMEEYYDISNTNELEDAQETREAEIAKAKLARIEKIVDLDADSPEDLLTSYVGKYIMQCPQCMTLFYKAKEDVVESEEDPDTVNVNEVCQHCGNESGYTLVGKVGEADADDSQDELNLEGAGDELPEEPTDDEATDENTDGTDTADESDIENELAGLEDLETLDLNLEDTEEETKEESFKPYSGEVLVENLTESVDELVKNELTDLLGLYAEKQDISDSNNGIRIFTIMNDQVQDKNKGHEEMIDILKKNGYQVTGETCLYNPLLKQQMSFIDVKNKTTTSTETKEELDVTDTKELVEELVDDKELDAKLEAHDEYIDYLRTTIAAEETKLAKADNEEVKTSIQKNVDTLKADLEAALPDAVKTDAVTIEEPVTVESEEADTVDETDTAADNAEEVKADDETDIQTEAYTALGKLLTESLTEDDDVSAEEFANLIKTCKPISDSAVMTMLASEHKNVQEDVQEDVQLDEASLMGTLTSLVKTRSGKADWILANARKTYDNIKTSADTKDDTNKLFKDFYVVCFNEKNSHKQIIDRPQHPTTKGLISAAKDGENTMGAPRHFKKYSDADKYASGWSIGQGHGPAFIYLHDGKEPSTDTAFLCEYFKGKLAYDQVNDYFKLVYDSIAGAKKANKAVDKAAKSAAKDSTASAGGSVGDLTPAMESLNEIMTGLDEVNESAITTQITESLTKAYKNVVNFQLSECAYADNKFTVSGTINFNSGNKRATTYTFTESYTANDGKISLRGINEKLGTDKCFTLTGFADNDKSFIAESLTYTNK